MKGFCLLLKKLRSFISIAGFPGRVLPVFMVGLFIFLGLGASLSSDRPSWAQPTSEPFEEDISSTKHNLSAIPLDPEQQRIFEEIFSPDQQRNVKTSLENGTTEVCVFCHTPHGASRPGIKIRAPIWNRQLPKDQFQMYDQVWSKSFEATPNDPGRPTGYSRLCLSCHDGTIALGSVLNKSGSGGLDGEYTMEYPTGQSPAGPFGSIPVGEGATSQNTRALGQDLRNDHPISMRFDTALLAKDAEFVNPGPPIHRPFTQSTPTPLSPLRRASGNNNNIYDSVQCTSCHNPHQVDFPKFLRANRLQSRTFASTQAEKRVGAATRGGPPQEGGAILCLFCHDKPGWPYNTTTGIPSQDNLNSHFGDRRTGVFDDSQLKPGATNLHDNEAPVVAERACLVCHDPHTRQGAIRILREGVDSVGNVSIETTCFQCHQPQESSILQAPTRAPDIRTQFFKDREGNGNHGTSPTGSAMDLTLGLGHQPVFVDLPKEGVQLGSDNVIPSFFGGPFQEPLNNKDINLENAPNTPDTSHVECVDCHNMHRVTRRNRFQGMPGVTIKSGIVARTLQRVDERREPYLYEVCLRCHGNTFNNHVREALFTALGTGKMVQARGNSPINPALGVNAHGSNKRKEFDPDSVPFYRENFRILDTANPNGPLVLDPNPPTSNTAFHPVFQPGRNQSGVLNNFNLFVDVPTQQGQLMGGMGSQSSFDSSGRVSGHDGSGGLSRRATIHCPDCHNTDLFGTFLDTIPQFKGFGPGGFPLSVNFPDYPGPISFDNTRGLTPDPPKRPTDRYPSIPEEPIGVRSASLNDPSKPQGPHGSIYKRILRANYDTTIGTADAKPPGVIKGQYNPQNFALCFNCHNESAFITPWWGSENCPPKDASGAYPAPKERLTNFYRCGTTLTQGGVKGGNLHLLHLVGKTNARCHECHNNVHSNIEAGNTIFVGMNDAQFKSDNPGHEMSSHLINFQPNIKGNRVENQPMWGAGHMVNGPASTNDDYGGGHKGPGCNIRCHGQRMNHNTDKHSVLGGQK